MRKVRFDCRMNSAQIPVFIHAQLRDLGRHKNVKKSNQAFGDILIHSKKPSNLIKVVGTSSSHRGRGLKTPVRGVHHYWLIVANAAHLSVDEPKEATQDSLYIISKEFRVRNGRKNGIHQAESDSLQDVSVRQKTLSYACLQNKSALTQNSTAPLLLVLTDTSQYPFTV